MKYLDFIKIKQIAKPITIFGEVFNAVTVNITGDMNKRIYKIMHIKNNKICNSTRVKVGRIDNSESKLVDKIRNTLGPKGVYPPNAKIRTIRISGKDD